jgi:hypothetical protein
MNNISFDIETLGHTYQAPIIQIGAVKFNQRDGIYDTFVRHIDLSSIDPEKFRIDPSTIGWWIQQDPQAHAKVFGNDNKTGLEQSLLDFLEWVGDVSQYNYWAHATFDPIILKSNFITMGLDFNLPFRQIRDLRTLSFLIGKIEVERDGVHHDALDDAYYQGQIVLAAMDRLDGMCGRSYTIQPEGDGILTFGKHSGKLYSEVWAQDRGWMDWIYSKRDDENSRVSKHLLNWIENKLRP